MRTLVLLLLATAAFAGPVEDAAEKALATHRAGDAAALKALAEKDDPDPWLVADELLGRGEHDAAEAIANAAQRKDTEKLQEYLTSRRGRPVDTAARAALSRALKTRDPQAALGMLSTGSEEPVTEVRIAIGRGFALRALGHLEESAGAFLAAAGTAERLSWLASAALALHEAGKSHAQRSDFKSALQAWERRLAIDEARGASPSPYTLMNVGVAQDALGNRREALSFYERALLLLKEPGDAANRAVILGNIGSIRHSLGEHKDALSCHERALEIDEVLGNRAGIALDLQNLGVVHTSMAAEDKAIACYERALAISEERGDKVGAAKALRGIAAAHRQRGRLAVAFRFYERALAIAEELQDRVLMADILGAIGVAHRCSGGYGEAIAYYRRGLAIRKEIGDEVGAAGDLNDIAISYLSLGNYAEALRLLQSALGTMERRNDRGHVAMVLSNIGLVHQGRGEYAKALTHHERALAIHQEIDNRSGIALCLSHMGATYSVVGEHAKAIALLERALAAHQELGDRAVTARAMILLATAHAGRAYTLPSESAAGERAKALSLYESAAALLEEVGDRGGAAGALSGIASLHHALGDLQKALALSRHALAIEEEIGNRPGAASTLSAIGLLYRDLGQYDKALEHLERARTLAEAIGAVVTEIDSMWRLALTHYARGDPREAAAWTRAAVARLPLVMEKFSEETGASWREQWAGLFDLGARAGFALDDAAEVSFFLESGRAMTLLESLGGRCRLQELVLPEDLCKAEADARAEESAALARYRGAVDGGGDAELSWQGLERARSRVLGVAQRIQREAKAQADVVYPEAAHLKRIQSSLRAGEALVTYGLLSDGAIDDALALVVRSDAARVVRLGKSSEIAKAASALQAAVLRPDERGVATPPHQRLDVLANRLRAILIEPLGLEDTKRLVVAPDAELGYVPFALLAPEVEIACVPSGTTYDLLLQDAALRGEEVLALGDPPAGDAQAAAVYRGGEELVPLPASRAEAQAIGDVVLVGKDATESGFLKAVASRPRWRAVHFACHGLVRADIPELSCLALGADSDNDGFLTVLEVFRLKIPSDLVVLSACETAKGKVYRAEGVIGLARAFMLAGSPRVICSLWKVDDAATKELMTTFYREWKPASAEASAGRPGVGAAAALKKAQEHVASQEQWKDPYFWAAWQLWGLPE